MAPLVRALTYASLFVAFFLFFLPARLLEWAGVSRPSEVDWVGFLGIMIGWPAFAAGFFVVTHVFVVVYEEPTLSRMFGHEYQAYCRAVGRWWPRRRPEQDVVGGAE